MRLLPRSLFFRTFLLITFVLVISQALSTFIVNQFINKPRYQELLLVFAENIHSIHSALLALPEKQRERFILNLADKQHFSVIEDAKGQALPYPKASEIPMLNRLLVDYLSEKDVSAIDVRIDRTEKPTVWVKLPVGEKRYWIGFPTSQIYTQFPWRTLVWLFIAGLITLLGSYRVVKRLNYSLGRLSKAAREVGQGLPPLSLPQKGPTEIHQVATALETMYHDIETLNKNRTLLLAGVSHDLRTPLARMRITLDLLNGENLHEMREEMIEDIESMDNIIEQFLTYIRRGGEEAFVETDINQLIVDVCQRYKTHAIEVDLATLPLLWIKPLAIRRVLVNLIDNSLKYANTTITISSQQADGEVVIDMLDRGPGIPEDKREQAFLPFTQLVQPKESHGGTGLGLAIVKRIIAMHHGRISLLERPGGGLQVRIYLPLTMPETSGNRPCG